VTEGRARADDVVAPVAEESGDKSESDARLGRGPYLAAAAVTLLLLALSARYGPHRDELYFIAAGHHPQWGYPDQPPLTPLLAAAADQLAHGSLVVLRLASTLLVGVVVLILADLARELGGARRAQTLAAIVTASASGVLAIGHLLSTATLDLFFWTLVLRLTVGLLHRDEPRGWLLVGLVAGVGLENKHLMAFLGAGLAVGIALTPSLRHHLHSPWCWAGSAIAVLLWLPNLIWQAAHGWPQLTLAGDVRDEYLTPGGTLQLVLFQVLLLSPLAAVLAYRGIVAMLQRTELAFARPVAIAYLCLLVVFIVSGGKHYYLLPLLAPLAAAGAVVTEQRVSARSMTRWNVWILLVALVPLPALLPVLPAKTLDGTVWADINSDSLETIGWPHVVAQVRDVVANLPAGDRRTAVVVTQNYGEAGALEWYGGTPPVYSGHNGFGDWGPPPATSRAVVYVGFERPPADQLTGCRKAATLHTGVDNEEDGNGVWICAGPAVSWARAWPHLVHLDA
jgi:4-amino-4-deoxy-L-arabinose transferase-like glycosyltransferase